MTAPPHSPAPPPADRPPAVWIWAQLLRAPNLLTVPGDSLAGALLAMAAGASPRAAPARLAIAVAVSLLLYSAGLLWNDFFDLAADRRERPDRPLPAGWVRPGTVALTANVMVALAVALAALTGPAGLYLAVALGGCVLAYDAFAKRLGPLGPLTMGACRGLSVLVGAAAMGPAGLTPAAVWAHAGGTALYIATITWLASKETRRTSTVGPALAIAAAAALWAGCLLTVAMLAPPPGRPGLPAFMGFFGWVCLLALWLASTMGVLFGRPEPPLVQRTVGQLICGLVLAQAAAAALAGPVGLAVAAGLTACAVANRLLARRFYAS